MKASIFLGSTLCLAATILATPTPHLGLKPRASLPSLNITTGRLTSPPPQGQGQELDAIGTFTQYSTNWAGVSHQKPPTGTTGPYTSIQATINVPTPAPPPSATGDNLWVGAAFVGIDGDGDMDSFLQAGVLWEVERVDDSLTYSVGAFWEFPPLSAVVDLPINIGDEIFISVNATSNTTIEALYINTSIGIQTTVNITAPAGESLAGANAQWIVETIIEDFSPIPFADFGEVTFKDCVAGTPGGSIGLQDAVVIALVDSNECAITSEKENGLHEFTVSYIGN